MSMRITDSMTSRSTLRDLQGDLNSVSDTMERASSGRRINKPSDDPYGASRTLELSGELDGLGQYQDNVSDGSAWLNATSSALGSLNDILQRARELVVGAGNDTDGPEGREASADEIQQLIDSVKQEANTQYAGSYIFSGTATNTPPYQSGANDAFAGNTGTISRVIGQNVSVPVNTDISGVVGQGNAAGDNGVLDTLEDIVTDLRGGTDANADNLRGTDLQRLDDNMDKLNQVVADVGARMNRLTTAGTRITNLQENTTRILSDTRDADYAQTLTDYSTQEAAYSAALQMGGRLIQNSLLDFLN